MILNLPERIDFNNISPHGKLYCLRACQGLVFQRIYFEKLRAMLGVKDIWQYLEIPLVITDGGWVAVIGIQWTTTRGADKHPTCRKAAPATALIYPPQVSLALQLKSPSLEELLPQATNHAIASEMEDDERKRQEREHRSRRKKKEK